MLVDIFSSFDDHNQIFMSFYYMMWLYLLVTILIFNTSFWLTFPRWMNLISMFKNIISSQVFCSLSLMMGGFFNIICGMFLFLILMNFSGLFPYVFSCTSHLAISLSLGLPMWFSLIVSSIFFNSYGVVASLLPAGAPSGLNPFLVLIETVSISVRPITLSVRLFANMSAGHIVLTLVGNYWVTSFLWLNSFSLLFLFGIQVFYTIFEFGIAIIQAYIFCLLLILYADEHMSYNVLDMF